MSLFTSMQDERKIILIVLKSHIAKKVQNNFGLNYKQSLLIVNQIVKIMMSKLENNEDVLISNFGRFSVKKKPERIGRNPATNKPMILKGRKVVTFKCSGKLREKVNNNR